jgi:hypothetical protein
MLQEMVVPEYLATLRELQFLALAVVVAVLVEYPVGA